ncbi:ankyrin [Aspergillus heteromorphus CBS 117.55]|uniref:Ankyrin n=1 Tax=Aspergillus heteromorphus CBS 117.55 TaxID=1448321 RepID=A0A317X0R2_9EURO|nr:ankyrin [Aspergillus heteromorphus CBS 117.55]PWY92186.1 ankyrin [Aspergillus heteromorphus CBS 117.55]
MATLFCLPPELLVHIYALGDVNDALQLRGTCRRLRDFFDEPRNADAILRGIMRRFFATVQMQDDILLRAMQLLAREIVGSERETISDLTCRWFTMKAFRAYGRVPPFPGDHQLTAMALLGECPPESAGQPLSWAVREWREPVAKLLLKKGADLEMPDESGRLPLARAAGNGSHAAVELLLEAGADVNAQDGLERTALMWAAINAQLPIMELLLDYGARPDTVDQTGANFLAYAAWSCNDAVFDFALSWCTLNECRDVILRPDLDGVTALHIACSTRCNIDLIRRLLDAGADITALTELGESPLMALLKTRFPTVGSVSGRFMGISPPQLSPQEMIERMDLLTTPELLLTPTYGKQLPLHYAVQRPHPILTEYILNHGGRAGLNHMDRDESTPLMIALDSGNEKVAEFLMQQPDIEFQARPGLSNEMHLAVRYCAPHIIRILLNYEPSFLDILDAEGRTPLFLAIQKSRLAHFKLLLMEGADIRITSSEGEDLLSYAAETEHGLPFFELLADSDLVKVNADGNSPLHRAVLGLSVQKVRDRLASPDTDLHARNLAGNTALHLAVHNGNLRTVDEIVEVLLASEPNGDSPTLASIANYGGKTALDFALERGRKDTIAVLVQRKWNATVGLEWSPTSEWIEKWSEEDWFPDLLHILQQSEPHIEALQQSLVKQWGVGVTAHRKSETSVQRSDYDHYLSLTIPTDSIPSPLRRITFTMVSHDQGWSNDNPVNLRNQCTYFGSRTWFEIVVDNCHRLGEALPRRRIACNLHASKNYRRQTVVWTLEDESPGLRDWIEAIQPGDTLYMVPRAKQNCWTNHVREMTVSVYYEREEGGEME